MAASFRLALFWLAHSAFGLAAAFGQGQPGRSGPLPAKAVAADLTWTPLLSRDLTGWKGVRGVWRVEQGELVGEFPEKEKPYNTFLCSEREYVDFELEFEVLLSHGAENSGVQVRSLLDDGERFSTRGPQVQIAEVTAGSRTSLAPTGSLVSEPWGQPWILADRAALVRAWKPGEFNRLHVRVAGKRVTIAANGVPTVAAEFAMLNKGSIAFQMPSGAPGQRVRFRNVRIRVLSDRAVPLPYAPLAGSPLTRREGFDVTPAELEVIDVINAYRAEYGLLPHGLSAALCSAARKHSQNMAEQEKLDHVLDEKTPGERAREAGFRGSIFENIAYGNFAAPRNCFELWVRSSGHRANILEIQSGRIGVGAGRAKAPAEKSAPSRDVDYYTAMLSPQKE